MGVCLSAVKNEPIVVSGSSGRLGTQVVHSLREQASTSTRIRAGTRHPSSAPTSLYNLEKVEVVELDPTSPTNLLKAFQGCKTAIVIPPNAPNRVQLTRTILRYAKKARTVRYIVLFSITVAGETESKLLGNEFREIEKFLESEIRIPACIVRFPFFFESIFYHSDQIKRNQHITDMLESDVKFPLIAMEDAAKIMAKLAVTPSSGKGKAYNITSEIMLSMAEITEVISKVLDQPLRYVVLRNSDAAEFWHQHAEPWQLDAWLEVLDLINKGKLTFTTRDFYTIMGKHPITCEEFIMKNKSVFEVEQEQIAVVRTPMATVEPTRVPVPPAGQQMQEGQGIEEVQQEQISSSEMVKKEEEEPRAEPEEEVRVERKVKGESEEEAVPIIEEYEKEEESSNLPSEEKRSVEAERKREDPVSPTPEKD